MDAATLTAICMLHAQHPAAYPLPSAAFGCPDRPTPMPSVQMADPPWLRDVVSTSEARDAMARTVIAEAGNQGDSGLAGVVYTILNRLADGRWGRSVEAVVDAPGQFEPVMRAGGSWRALRPVSEVQAARVSTIVNLVLDGRLPDLTGGARYFQNAQVVAARARAGTISPRLVNFGGRTPSAVIGAHAFYVDRAPAAVGSTGELRRRETPKAEARAGEIFVGENRVDEATDRLARTKSHSPAGPSDHGDGIFVP